ncbi:MAG TPA: SMR family transporter [Syntrophales bacterium]|nr:SMR family transporter [Syntrophales bacterium]HPQ42618.1 SMR family transporter [Syntrophales bacterium]
MKAAYVYLAVAIVAEVVATSALKASEEFTRWIPSLIVIIGYGMAFYYMTLALRSIPLGITYAVWAGLGIVLVTVAGAVLYKQIPDIPAMIGIGLIIAGIIVIKLFSKTISS